MESEGSMKTEETIFAEALELPPSQRREFLTRACGDESLRRRVEVLIKGYEGAGAALEESPFARRTGEAASSAHSPPPDHEPGAWVGRYKLLQRLGEGGHGTVFVAEQEEPVRRRVALKLIKLGMDTREVIARFEAERQALALMDHPNIARVLDAGATESGRPYFVMELVRGISITRHCDEHQLDAADRLRLFIQVCAAVQHAHQKGIIHRDLKPSNILVTLHDGVPVPKVIDFGIAKAMHGRLTERTLFTRFEQFVGTPAYMSPEQLEMSGLDVDTRSDIYSLGVILYELLTGRPPFESKELLQVGLDEMRRTIREKEPLRPSTQVSTFDASVSATVARQRGTDPAKLRSWLRGDIDWIVMRCLEKDRNRRYETANDLAKDLQRYLRNEPVVARPPNTAYVVRKFIRRHRVGVAASAAVASAIVVGSIATEAERERAEQRESEARHRAYASDMNIAKQALDDNLGRAVEMLEQHVPKNQGEADLRGWEWRYLWSQTRSDALFTLCRLSGEIYSLSVSSDGNLVAASVPGRGGLSIWDIPDRRELLRLVQGEQDVCAVISPTEPLLAFTGVTYEPSGQQRSSLRLWNLAARQIVTEKPLDGECAKLAISKDGGTLVTITVGERTTYNFGGNITLWRLPELTPLKSYPSTGLPRVFAVTPDLDLAAISGDGTRLVDLRDGRELWSRPINGNVLAFSANGKLLAEGREADILIWDVPTGQEIARLSGHHSRVESLVFWPDGNKLASGSADQTIRIWDVPNRVCVDTLRGHRQQVWHLALMPDHQTLVSGCRDGSVCLWDTSVDHTRRPRLEIPDSALTWAFEADGKSVVTLNGHGRVTRWKGANFDVPEPLLEVGEISDQTGFMWCFSNDGRRLALGSADGPVCVWDIPRRVLWRKLSHGNGRQRAVKFFAKGNRLITFATEDLLIHDWDLETGSEVQSWRAPADILHFALSPDERFCVVLGFAGDVQLRDLVERTTTKLDLDIRESHDGNYSPDARLLAVPSSLGFVRVWNTTTWSEVQTLHGFFDQVYGAAFLSDGKRLAAVAGDRDAVRLYDTSMSTWLDTLTLEGDGHILAPTMISPDGNIIGTRSAESGHLQLWRAPSWDEINQAKSKNKDISDR